MNLRIAITETPVADDLRALDAARKRAERRMAEHVPIDYAAANKAHRRHKAALTRATNSGDPLKVQRVVVATVREWNASGWPWPDDWSRWQRALDDATGYGRATVRLEDIR